MTNEKLITRVTKARDRVEEAEARVADRRQEFRDACRKAKREGVKSREIAAALDADIRNVYYWCSDQP